MKIEGGCYCGQITFEAEAKSATFGICHCSECQVFTGSAFNTAIAVSAVDFLLLTGTPKTFVKTAAQSGRKVLRAFCGTCGSPIFRHSIDDPSIYRISLGSIKQRAMFAPVRQIWKCSALPWVETISDIRPVFEQNPL